MRLPGSARILGAYAVGLALVASPVPARAGTGAPPPDIVVQDGMTQPVFSFADAIEERVWVETPLDTDSDGRRDRVVVDISRPRETDTRGLRVPVILENSPYRKDTWDDVPYPSVLVDDLPQNSSDRSSAARDGDLGVLRAKAKAKANLPGQLDDYYVPRGYAVMSGTSIGTGDSDGCPTSGDRAETLGTKAIIDWLNGRARGFDATGAPVRAGWTTGSVGMTGASYNGTLPNMVATTGVEGLKTIIPVAAISNWYDYYRANGLVVAPGNYQGEDADILTMFTAGQARSEGPCADEIAEMAEEQDRVSGDYTEFWQDRNYLPEVRRVRASVMVVHGLNDWNVKTGQFADWWEQLARFGVPRKLWLHQGGHGGPGSAASVTLPDGRSWTYRQMENRWLDHWLWGVDNDIMAEPRVVVQREDQAYTTYPDWPDRAARDVSVDLSATSPTAPGELLTHGPRGRAEQGLVDSGRTIAPADLVAGPETANPNRLVYTSPALRQDVRVSGRPELRVRLSIDNRTAANLTGYLVDYGPAGSTDAPFVVTRGWLDPQNRTSESRSRPVRQGQMYDYRWALEPKDYVFPAGHRLGVVIFSSDQEYTLLPLPGTRLTVAPKFSSLTIPVVGGRAALGF